MKWPILVAMAYTNVIMGMVDGSIGVSLVFLQDLYNSPLDQVSSLFVFLGIGDVLASACFSPVVDKYDVFLLMVICSLVAAVAIVMVPATTILVLGLVAACFYGLSYGLLYCGTYHLVPLLFSGRAYLFHILSGSYSMGAFIGPILIDQFLRASPQGINTTFDVSEDWSGFQNETKLITTNLTDALDTITEQHIQIVKHVYLVFGLLYAPIPLTWFTVFMRTRHSDYVSFEEEELVSKGETANNKKHKIIFICMSAILVTLSGGSSHAYGSYITSVTSAGSLHWTIQRGVWMTTLFWLCLLVGVLVPIGLSLMISQKTLMYACLSGSITAISSVLWSYISSQETLFWIGSMALALFQGPTFATAFSWSGNYVPFSSRVLSLYVVADGVALNLLPYVNGIILDSFGETAHFYFHFSLISLQFILFVSVHMLGHLMSSAKKSNTPAHTLTEP